MKSFLSLLLIPLTTSSISIYPNPASDYIVLDLESYSPIIDMKVEMYDLLGGKVLEQKINNTVTNISLSNLSPASYVILVKNNAGEIVREEKIIKTW